MPRSARTRSERRSTWITSGRKGSPMKLGIHAFAWTNHWDKSQLPLFDRAKVLGLDFLEVPLLALDDVDPVAIRASARDAGMGVVTSTTLSHLADITSDDAEVREAGVAYLKRCV